MSSCELDVGTLRFLAASKFILRDVCVLVVLVGSWRSTLPWPLAGSIRTIIQEELIKQTELIQDCGRVLVPVGSGKSFDFKRELFSLDFVWQDALAQHLAAPIGGGVTFDPDATEVKHSESSKETLFWRKLVLEAKILFQNNMLLRIHAGLAFFRAFASFFAHQESDENGAQFGSREFQTRRMFLGAFFGAEGES